MITTITSIGDIIGLGLQDVLALPIFLGSGGLWSWVN